MHQRQRFNTTLLTRTFLLIGALLFVCVTIWLSLFTLAEQAPRARQVAHLTASAVHITNAALLAASPKKRKALLHDLAESEGVLIYPAEEDDTVTPLEDSFFFNTFANTTLSMLGDNTQLASNVNGIEGLWVSFALGDDEDDIYWLMLPSEHTFAKIQWQWLTLGALSLAMALFVAWLIASRITKPLRDLSYAAKEVGQGHHPEPIQPNGATELCQLAETFNLMAENLQQSESERAIVLAGISHDLRTPLSRLRLEAELSIHDDDARQGFVEDIELMDEIIAQFLDYARNGADESIEIIDAEQLICHAIGSIDKNKLEISVAPALSIKGRPKALTRVISNLVENAKKYGDGLITINAFIKQESNGKPWATIEVLDRGPGIPADKIEHLKRPFTRLESARTNVTGTGLGLAIVERTAKLHGGVFNLLAREGGGLIARIQLPQ